MTIENGTFGLLVTILSDIASGRVTGFAATNHAQAALDTLEQKSMITVEKDGNTTFHLPVRS